MDENQADILIYEFNRWLRRAYTTWQTNFFIDSYLYLNIHHELPLLGQPGGVLVHWRTD